MQEVLYNHIFPHLSYLDIRNLSQTAKVLFSNTNYQIDQNYMDDDILFNELNYKAQYYWLGDMHSQIDYKIVYDQKFPLAKIYKEIYQKTTSLILEHYHELPKYVDREKFINEMTVGVVSNLEWEDYNERHLDVNDYFLMFPLVSDKIDVTNISDDVWYNENTNIKLSDEAIKYCKYDKYPVWQLFRL